MDRIKQILDYDYLTGIFTWKVNRGRSAKAGDVAGTLIDGYVKIKVFGKLHAAHRLAFEFQGLNLEGVEVDHANGIKNDNRLENLRTVTKSLNQRNSKRRKSNTTGFKNVSKKGDKFLVTIRTDGKQKYIGKFSDLEFAALVAEEARNKYHGEYARHS